MADNTLLPQLMAILQQQQEQDAATQQLLQQPAQTGLLTPGQSVGDLLTSPTGPQNQALLQFGLSLLGSTDRDPLTKSFSDAAQSGLNILGQARGQARTQQLQAAQAQSQALQRQFGDVLGAGRLGVAEREAGVAERGVGVREQAASLAETRLLGDDAQQIIENNMAERQQTLRERMAEFDQLFKLSQGAPVSFGEKELIRKTTKMFSDLKGAEGDLRETADEIRALRDEVEKGGFGIAGTGALGTLRALTPFTFTESGQNIERLDALAEKAARAQLKAMGEIRPTDADVVGMKRALFGVGKDDEVNLLLMDSSLDAIASQLQFIDSADNFLAENQDLRGFKPPVLLRSSGGVSFTKD